MRISYWSSDVCSSDLDDAFLVAGLAVCGADAGDDEEAAGLRRARRPDLLPRTDDAVEPGVARERGETDDLIVRGAVDADVGEVGGVEAGQHRHRDDFRADAGRGLRLFEHRASARGVDGEDRGRSEEHTSELQSLMRLSYAVFCLKK